MTIQINSIEIPQQYFDLCGNWYDGQNSMFQTSIGIPVVNISYDPSGVLIQLFSDVNEHKS